MKKSRPAVTISVLCSAEKQKDMENILLVNTSSFGLRSYKVSKAMLKREIVKEKTRYGEVSIKKGYMNGCMIKSKPEYEDCRKLAKENGVSIQDIYESIRWVKRNKK
jgi:hypothetical protein